MVITKFQASSGPVRQWPLRHAYIASTSYSVLLSRYDSLINNQRISQTIWQIEAAKETVRDGHQARSINPRSTPRRDYLSSPVSTLALPFEALVNIAESGNTENARITAACAILDRAFGKPREAGLMQYKAPSSFDDFLGE